MASSPSPPPKAPIVQCILDSNPQKWEAATKYSSFIMAIQSGNISKTQFNKWLYEDYWFVYETIRIVSALLSCSYDSFMRPYLRALTFFHKELLFSRRLINTMVLGMLPPSDLSEENSLSVLIGLPPSSPLNNYISMGRKLKKDIGVVDQACDDIERWKLLVFHYVAEKCYYKAWTSLDPSRLSDELKMYRSRWASEEFATYIDTLEHILAREYEDGEEEVKTKTAKEITEGVLDCEIAFWNYCMEAKS